MASVNSITWQWSQSANGQDQLGQHRRRRYQDADLRPSDDSRSAGIRPRDCLVRGPQGGRQDRKRGISSRSVGAPPPVNSAPVVPIRHGKTAGGSCPKTSATATRSANRSPPPTSTSGDTSRQQSRSKYSLSGTDAASFTIDARTPGQLSLAAERGELDYETKRSYRVTVQVTDGYGTALGDDEDPDVIDARINMPRST